MEAGWITSGRSGRDYNRAEIRHPRKGEREQGLFSEERKQEQQVWSKEKTKAVGSAE